MTTTKKHTTITEALRIAGASATNLSAVGVIILVSDDGLAITATSIDPNTQALDALSTVYEQGDNGKIAAQLGSMLVTLANGMIQAIDNEAGDGKGILQEGGPVVVALKQNDDGSLTNDVWDALKNSVTKH